LRLRGVFIRVMILSADGFASEMTVALPLFTRRWRIVWRVRC
jgi:hypothetical protein